MVVFEALVGCHDVLIFGESPIKWRQRPDMAIAADCDVKHQFKQTITKMLIIINVYLLEDRTEGWYLS